MPDETSPLLSPPQPRGSATHLENVSDNVDGGEAGLHPQDPQTISYMAVVLPLSIGLFLAAMDITIVVSSYAAIGSELKQLRNMNWIPTSYMITMTCFLPLCGKLSDVFGRKQCLLAAYFIFGIGCLGCGLSRSMNQLIANRALTGVGSAVIQTISSVVLTDIVPLRARGTWQGVLVFVFTLGSATGAPLGGFTTDTIGWRWAFILQVPIAVLAMISVYLALHLPEHDSSNFYDKLKRIDFMGSFSLILTIFFLLVGLDRGGNIEWWDHLTILSLCGSFLCLIVFVVIETRFAKEPFAPKRIITNRSLIACYVTNFFGMMGSTNPTFYVPLYLQAVRGKTASETGLWLLSVAAGTSLGALCGGLIMQATGKFYFQIIASYGMMLLGDAMVKSSMDFTLPSAILLCAGLFVINLGSGSGMSSSLIASIANAGKEDQAIATSVLYLFRALGMVVGVSLGSSLIQETLRSYLRLNLSGHDIDKIIARVRESLGYLERLDPATRAIVKHGYADAIQAAMTFTVIMASCSFMYSFFIKEATLVRK